jgi:hypothetical protein
VLAADDAATITTACKAEADRNGCGRLLSLIDFAGVGYATSDVTYTA